MNIVNLGTYPPKQCGIATFSQDLRDNLLTAGYQVKIAAISDETVTDAYPDEVCWDINKHRYDDYIETAELINRSPSVEVCIIQHEYGIFGGPDGEYVLAFIDRLKKPYIMIAHTVLKEPSVNQKRVFTELSRHAAAIVCMTHRSIRITARVYQVPLKKLHFIHHGVPEFPVHNRDRLKDKYGWTGRKVITTFGLIGPGKGLENGLKALAMLKDAHHNALYLIAGQLHPVLMQREGDGYYRGLQALTNELGLDEQVVFDNQYLSLEKLGDYLYMTDIYLTPYPNREQAVSGTLAFALGCGRAVVATPYEYALEMLQGGRRGLIASCSQPECLADPLNRILTNPALQSELEEQAAKLGQKMKWSYVARQYGILAQKMLPKSAKTMPRIS